MRNATVERLRDLHRELRALGIDLWRSAWHPLQRAETLIHHATIERHQAQAAWNPAVTGLVKHAAVTDTVRTDLSRYLACHAADREGPVLARAVRSAVTVLVHEALRATDAEAVYAALVDVTEAARAAGDAEHAETARRAYMALRDVRLIEPRTLRREDVHSTTQRESEKG